MIEASGIGGMDVATDLAGEEIAMAILIAKMRAGFKDHQPRPSDVEVKSAVNDILMSRGLI